MVAFFPVGTPQKGMKIIKSGRHLVEGISSYGMTLGPKITFPMQAVMKNIEVSHSLACIKGI